MQYRVGIGYDIHRFVEGRALLIGGVEIPYIKGLLGHSDADVLIHAICDALLGAVGEKDIGELFPDTEAQYQGIAGSKLLKEVSAMVQKNNYKIENIDTVIIAEEPPIAPFKSKIRENIANILNISVDAVNVKAKTNEGLGEIGQKEAIASYVIVNLSRGGER